LLVALDDSSGEPVAPRREPPAPEDEPRVEADARDPASQKERASGGVEFSLQQGVPRGGG